MATLTDGAKQLKKMYDVTMRVAAVKRHLQEHNMLDIFLLLMFDGKKVKHKRVNLIEDYFMVNEEEVCELV
eukprot:4683707-Ditylum_brightwellii.AAC.1